MLKPEYEIYVVRDKETLFAVTELTCPSLAIAFIELKTAFQGDGYDVVLVRHDREVMSAKEAHGWLEQEMRTADEWETMQ